MSDNSNVASATLLSMTNSVVVFTSLLPPFADVRKASPMDPDMLNDVRLGEAAASALVIGVGLVASNVTGSSAPTIVSVIAAVALVGMYESVLRGTGGHAAITHTEGVDY